MALVCRDLYLGQYVTVKNGSDGYVVSKHSPHTYTVLVNKETLKIDQSDVTGYPKRQSIKFSDFFQLPGDHSTMLTPQAVMALLRGVWPYRCRLESSVLHCGKTQIKVDLKKANAGVGVEDWGKFSKEVTSRKRYALISHKPI